MEIELNKKENKKTEIPIDDTLQILNKYATYYNMSDKDREKIIKKRKEEAERKKEAERENKNTNETQPLEEEDPTLGYDKVAVDDIVEIHKVKYKVKEIINDKNGFQAIIFQNLSTNESVLSIGGSFPVAKPFSNLQEWYNDWVSNNARVGMDSLPPQFFTALETLDKYKEKYNIKDVVGYSLGAILAGMISSFERHSDVRAYMYNGGLPTKMFKKLLETYGDEIKLDSSNMITLLSNKELLTNLISVVEGAGIYELAENKDGEPSTHTLENHDGASRTSYLKLIEQSGWEFADTLKMEMMVKEAVGPMVNVSFSPGFSSKKTREATPESLSEQSAETKRIIKAINKNGQARHINQPTGYASPISFQENADSDIEEENQRRERQEKLKEWIRRIRESELHREEELQRLRMIPPGFQKRITTNGKPYYTDGFSYYINRQDLHEEIEHVFQQGLEDFITRMGFVRYNYN